jgi:hypothetical protein
MDIKKATLVGFTAKDIEKLAKKIEMDRLIA